MDPSDPFIVSARGAIRRRLLPWFRTHRRDLPWRRRRTPYRVWIAELMLQQTRTDQALPYYRRFMRRFPSVRALARAPRQDVLKAWEGLGYYARARNLHRTAQYIVSDRRGRFPATYEEWLNLPGIGPYTAAAVTSIAFNRDHAVVDGNVARVLSRVFAYSGDVKTARGKREIQRRADVLLPAGRAADFNEALMELGALVCLPRRPRCAACPMRAICRAYHHGEPEAFPAARARKRVPHKIVGAGIVTSRAGKILIAQRKDDSMLGGLWEFPGGSVERGETLPQCIRRELREELGIDVRVGARVVTVHHAYSHFTIELHAYRAAIERGRPRALHCADYRWVTVREMRDYPFSRADLHIRDALENQS